MLQQRYGIYENKSCSQHLAQVNEPIVFSADGNILACNQSNDVILWDLSVPEEPLLIGETGAFYSTPYNTSNAISPDNTIYLESEHLLHDWFCEAQIQLWDINSGNMLLTLYGHTESINSLTFSPDGKTLASGSEDGTCASVGLG